MNIVYHCGIHPRDLLCSQKGESDLALHNGEFYLLATCDLPDPTKPETEAALGVDLGMDNLATTSGGETHTRTMMKRNRLKHQRLRRNLQK